MLHRLESRLASGWNRTDDVEIADTPPASGWMATTIVPVAASLGLVAIATVALFAGRSILPHVNLVSIVYLLPVLFAATRWGLLPAVVSAFAGAAAADYFFYPPIYSLQIGDTQNIADLVVFLIIAFVTSHYMARLRRRSESLARSRRELRSLYAFSCQLAACFTVPDLIAATGNYLSETLGHRTILVGPDDESPAAEFRFPITCGATRSPRPLPARGRRGRSTIPTSARIGSFARSRSEAPIARRSSISAAARTRISTR